MKKHHSGHHRMAMPHHRHSGHHEGIPEGPEKSNPRARYDYADSAFAAQEKACRHHSDPLAHAMMHEDRRPSQHVKGEMIKDPLPMMTGSSHGGRHHSEY